MLNRSNNFQLMFEIPPNQSRSLYLASQFKFQNLNYALAPTICAPTHCPYCQAPLTKPKKYTSKFLYQPELCCVSTIPEFNYEPTQEMAHQFWWAMPYNNPMNHSMHHPPNYLYHSVYWFINDLVSDISINSEGIICDDPDDFYVAKKLVKFDEPLDYYQGAIYFKRYLKLQAFS